MRLAVGPAVKLLPLTLAADATGWTRSAPDQAGPDQAGLNAEEGVLNYACAFCGARSGPWRQPCTLDESEHAPAPAHPVWACPLCALARHLERPRIDDEACLIWLPEMSQAAVNAMLREIHRQLRRRGDGLHAEDRIGRDEPERHPLHHARAALAQRAASAASRLGTSLPSDLGRALVRLSRAARDRRAALLGGLRLLPLGRFYEGGEDVYPRVRRHLAGSSPAGGGAVPVAARIPARGPRSLAIHVAKGALRMILGALARALASVSLALKQPLQSFCTLETAHGDSFVTKSGHYVSWIRVDGMQKMGERDDFMRIAEAMRLDLSGALETAGHAIAGWYISDPDAALVEIEHINLSSCRAIAREAGLNLDDILEERARLWPKLMRWEASAFMVWTRTSVLTKEERKQLRAEYAATASEAGANGALGDTQRFHMRSEVMAARHGAFTSRVLSALRAHDVTAAVMEPHDALKLAREAMYREMSGSEWRPILPGDRVMARRPDDDATKLAAEHVLWPPLREQLFYADAVTHGGQRVTFGDNDYGCVDMNIGPEDPRPFVELAATLGQDRIPWRVAILIEGGGKSSMQFKDIGASFLSMFPGNADLRRAFAFLREVREKENHISVKLRLSFATWAPTEEPAKLRRRVSTLAQRIEGWGNAKTTTVVGDPLEGVMSSAPGLALSSTANPALALLGDALTMLPWNRTASPWEAGSVLFRRPDGGIWPYDPSGGRRRPLVVDIFVAPPGSGKSVLANTINIGLCLSSAVLGSNGPQTAADRQGGHRQVGRGLRAADAGGARPATPSGGDLRLLAVRSRLRVQHIRPAGGLRVSAAAGARLPAKLPAARDPAARRVKAVRGHGAADRAGDRRGLPALHRSRRGRQALSSRRRAGGGSGDRPPRHRAAS